MEQGRLKNDTSGNGGQKLNEVWKPPMQGVVKINSDASVVHNGAGLGGVVRDDVGDVVVATCWFVAGTYDVDIAEAMALRHALNVSIEAGFARFELEVDNMKLYSYLSKDRREPTPFSSIIADIKFLCSLCHYVNFSFIKRVGNQVAHSLANLSHRYDGLRVWFEESPLDVAGLVAADVAASFP